MGSIYQDPLLFDSMPNSIIKVHKLLLNFNRKVGSVVEPVPSYLFVSVTKLKEIVRASDNIQQIVKYYICI